MQKKLIRLFSIKITLVSYWTLDLFYLTRILFLSNLHWHLCKEIQTKHILQKHKRSLISTISLNIKRMCQLGLHKIEFSFQLLNYFKSPNMNIILTSIECYF